MDIWSKQEVFWVQKMLKVTEGAAINNISLFSALQTFQLCYISMHIKVTNKQTNE